MTDFYKMSSMMKELFPSNPQADKQALKQMANAPAQEVAPTKDYVTESVTVPQGSMPIGIDNVSDFAKLAGIVTEGKQKTGSQGQAKGSDSMPKMSKPSSTGEQPHPLKDKLVGEEDDPFIKAVDNSFGQSSVANKIGFSPKGELYKILYKAIKAIMPNADETKIKKAADAASQQMESVKEADIDIMSLTPAATTLGGALDPDMDPSALIARGLKKAGDGETLSQDEREAIKPYIALFSELMTNPAYRNNLISMQKTLKKSKGKDTEPEDDEETKESGLQYYTGVKKYGKEGMEKLAQAGREGASEEELGRIKDKYKKTESIKEHLYRELNKRR